MLKLTLRAAAVAAALLAVPAAATTITWSGLGTGALTGSYSEGGYLFTWSAASYSQVIGGTRVVDNNPNLTGATGNPATNFTVTKIDGGLFSFDSVTAANLNGLVGAVGSHRGSVNTQFIAQGFLNGSQIYGPLLAANANALTNISSGESGVFVDSLTFILGGGVFPTDIEGVTNIQLTAAPVPEPAMLGLFGLGAAGVVLTRRRKTS